MSKAKNLDVIRVQRCYYVGDSSVTELQLHIFCDASERAYGCAAYLRLTLKDGSCKSVLVMSKSRLAPIKVISLPRLELSGAVIAARLYHFIIHEIDLPIERVCFWTDSTLVLQYVTNERQRFKTFFANRITEIGELTDPSNFRHVPGKLNPADLLTRGVSDPADLMTEDEHGVSWFVGPRFLTDSEEDWPVMVVPPLDEEDVGIKKKAVLVALSLVQPEQHVIDPLRFSSWTTFS